MAIFPCQYNFRFPLSVPFIPSTLSVYLHYSGNIFRRTNGRSLITFIKQCYFGNRGEIDRQILPKCFFFVRTGTPGGGVGGGHQGVTADFCPSTLQAISELAIHLAQEQYKNRPGWKGGRGYVREVRKSGNAATLRSHTHAAPDTLDSCDYSI